MKNKEMYKDEILAIACRGEQLAVKNNGTPHSCLKLACDECIGGMVGNCRDAIYAWCEEEYVEPCPFETDELVEVSADNINWLLRHFSHIEDGIFYTYSSGHTSKETLITTGWAYCRKYGTLGGIAKGE